jgi:D-glycero-alpha-D-manno-heptose-7-phosphate kinase
MLISQGPLRVSLFGGGSDLPSFLSRNEGAVLSFAINRKVFIAGHPFTHRDGILLKYSQTEDVSSPRELQHPIAREILDRYGVNDVDLAVMADVPAGTGLGSSSAFTVAFLALVRHLTGRSSTPADLAREACEIEIEILKEPIGYQDQWASALGGLNVLRFSGRDVSVERIPLTSETVDALQSNLHLVPVGAPRRARSVLADQDMSLTSGSAEEKTTRRLASMVDEGHQALLEDIDQLGPLLAEAWELKKQVAPNATNQVVDELYEHGRSHGATGGKLLGAGGSGYLAFYVPSAENQRFTTAMPTPLTFTISPTGAGVIHES